MYIGRVDKEELEVVKWIWPSVEKEWKERVEYRSFGWVPLSVSMSGRCGGERGHPCSLAKVGYGVLVYVSSELTAGFRD